jgi:hypothetical protein
MSTHRGNVRLCLPLTASVALLFAALALGAGAAHGLGLAKWEAGTCAQRSCSERTPESFYTQAAGHPPYGITDFRFDSKKELLGILERPEGNVKDVRVDLPSGLAVDPEAVPTCSQAQIESSSCPPESKVGEDEALGAAAGVAVKESFPVYNMERNSGESARFGVEVKSALISLLKLESIIYLQGGLSWYHEAEAPGGETSGLTTGDYHEFFEIHNLPKEPEVIESRLIFWGVPYDENGGLPNTDKAFITMPSTCNGPQVTWLHFDSYEDPGQFTAASNETPVGASGCNSLEYEPQVTQKPETTQSDAPDGTEVVIHVPQRTEEPARNDSPDLLEATVTLPEGMTLDPSAANGLQACSGDQFKMGTDQKIECPAASVLGSVVVDAPGVPDGSLKGSVYLGTPESVQPESGREYRILLAAQAPEYDIGLRLEGHVSANSQTGRLTAVFSDLPPVPFEDFTLKFNGGPTAPLANPLACGAASTSANLLPASGEPPASPQQIFVVAGGGCPSPSFAVGQSAQASSTKAASSTSFTLGLTRPEGQQYISDLSAALPEGMIGEIPAVPLCDQADASAQKCSAASQIGTASVTIGSGSSPLALPAGPVYLTGPYEGAPFGLEVLTNAEKVGPFDYGTILTRAKIEIDPYTARVSIVSSLPTIVGGVPIRLRSVNVSIDHPGFMLDPTSCGLLSTNTSLLSTFGARETVAAPFQATGCGSLPFTPTLSASTNAKTTRRFGASLAVSIAQKAHQANIKSVAVMLPRKLVARLSTLQQACLEKTFALNVSSCPKAARVGSATVVTPALPGKLTGSAYFVSHGGAAFPNLDLVLEGDGVRVILVGDTEIKGAYTHSSFASLPDVPIESFSLSLPRAANSALAANGSLCAHALHLPTTIVGQNGKKITQRTKIRVAGCKKSKQEWARRRSKRRHPHH